MGVKQTLSPYCISYVKEFEFTIIGYCGILLLGMLFFITGIYYLGFN